MKAWTSTAAVLLIGFLSGVLTIQLALAGDVRDSATKMNVLDRDQERLRVEFNMRMDEADSRWEKRMQETDARREKQLDRIMQLWEASLTSNTELISLVKLQMQQRPPPPRQQAIP